jgi:hypothetical protein
MVANPLESRASEHFTTGGRRVPKQPGSGLFEGNSRRINMPRAKILAVSTDAWAKRE